MKKKICTILVALVLCCVTLLSACGFQPLKGGPELTDDVSGNGGITVQKGDYLYFVNGYQTVTSLTDGDNTYNAVNYSAIYRVKLDDNNQITYDEDGLIENCELLIPKVCGFEKTNLYIYDNYIYYATPNTNKVVDENNNASVDFGYTDFCRANLDGSGITYLYKTNNKSDSTKYEYYKIGNTVYLGLYDGSKLLTINCSTKAVTTITEKVSSVVFPSISGYSYTNTLAEDVNNQVYYTRTAEEDEKFTIGNVLASASLVNGEETIIKQDNFTTYTATNFTNEGLVYTKKSTSEANAYHYVAKFVDKKLDIDNTEKQLTFSAHSNAIYLPDYENSQDRGIITTNAGGYLVRITSNGTISSSEILNEDTTLTPLYVEGDFVYAYDANSSLYRVNFKTKAFTILTDTTDADNLEKAYTSATVNFDYSNGYIYFYKEYKGDTDTGYYLNRIYVLQPNEVSELVGVIQENHIATESEDEE